MKQNKFVAFLRGVNVGGRQIKMEELKKALAEANFSDVQTVIASGNVIFESETVDEAEIKKRIEDVLEKKFGFKIGIAIRNEADLQKLLRANPFEKIKTSNQTRLYVTFLPDKKHEYKIPDFGSEFRVLDIIDGTIFSYLELKKNGKTLDLMKLLEKEFGKEITTRNWNTVLKIGKLL